MSEVLKLWGICQGDSTGTGTIPRERGVLPSAKPEGWSHLNPLATAGLSLALAHHFLTIPQFLHFGMVTDILCHCMLKVCNRSLIVHRVTYNEKIALVSKETLNIGLFKQCWECERLGTKLD